MNSLQIKVVDYCDEIDAIKRIRTKVFQQEQRVLPELEFDGLDQAAIHLLAYSNNQAVGTARIREINTDTVKIERLAVLKNFRKQGIARQLMRFALNTVAQDKTLAVVHAQEYIASLYQQLGFTTVGDRFTEAGIAHVKMIKHLSPTNYIDPDVTAR